MTRLPPAERRLRQRLAKNVRTLREKRSLSLHEIGERSELHWRLIQKVEAGETNATLRTLLRLAQALGVEPDDLLRDVQSP